MLTGFWGWFLVIVLVVAVFSADRLPDLKKLIESKTKEGLDAVKKGTKSVEEKIAKAKAARKQDSEDKPEDEE